MGAAKMPSALDNSFNQNMVGAVHSMGVSEEDQFMSGHGVINQPGFNNIAQTAKVMVSSKAKRVTAATREIHSGTNARVNTFDNRGLQAQQNHQYEQVNRYHHHPGPPDVLGNGNTLHQSSHQKFNPPPHA